MSGVTDRDMGYDSLMAELRELGQAGNPRVYVGILQDKGSETTEDGITLAGYAAVNEFGSSDGRMTSRSALIGLTNRTASLTSPKRSASASARKE